LTTRTRRLFTACTAGLLFLAVLSPAPALTIKLGSLAPEGSPWDSALKKLAVEWNRISRGQVTLKIFPGGIAGDEPDMVRKIRINQLQAAAITGIGLQQIANDILTIQLPLLIRTDGEFEYVLAEMQPTFNTLLEQKGFTALAWSLAGWATFFTRDPVIYPQDLMKQKLQVDDGSPEMTQAWKKMGFHVVPLPATSVMSALQSGMVEAFTLTPLTAAAMQWFALAPNMAGLRWAPMVGGIIISNRTWARVPDNLKPELLAAIRVVLADLEGETRALEDKALEVMLNNGLQVHPLPAAAEEEWRRVVEDGFGLIIGKSFSAQVYEEIRTHLEVYRASFEPEGDSGER
jgi:TRAP-type C4-dicarboxylate transport system substrate-binding protein